VTAVAAGRGSSYAIESDGTVWAWGSDGYGELGDDSRTNATLPVRMLAPGGKTAVTDVASIAGGGNFTLILRRDGSVLATGYDTYGDLGDNGAPNPAQIPVVVAGLSGVISVAAGYDTGIAVRSDGTVWAWGRNAAGELGAGSTGGQRNAPGQVAGINGARLAAAGGSPSGSICLAVG
jgi:alpha-tubulin suppressor-like RCC1 family protein